MARGRASTLTRLSGRICGVITSKGTPCRNHPAPGSAFCSKHPGGRTSARMQPGPSPSRPARDNVATPTPQPAAVRGSARAADEAKLEEFTREATAVSDERREAALALAYAKSGSADPSRTREQALAEQERAQARSDAANTAHSDIMRRRAALHAELSERYGEDAAREMATDALRRVRAAGDSGSVADPTPQPPAREGDTRGRVAAPSVTTDRDKIFAEVYTAQRDWQQATANRDGRMGMDPRWEDPNARRRVANRSTLERKAREAEKTRRETLTRLRDQYGQDNPDLRAVIDEAATQARDDQARRREWPLGTNRGSGRPSGSQNANPENPNNPVWEGNRTTDGRYALHRVRGHWEFSTNGGPPGGMEFESKEDAVLFIESAALVYRGSDASQARQALQTRDKISDPSADEIRAEIARMRQDTAPTPSPAPEPIPGAVDLAALKAAPDRDAAAAMLAGMKAAEIRAFATANGLTPGRGTKAQMINSLVNQALGAKMRREAMRDTSKSELGYTEDIDRQQRERVTRLTDVPVGTETVRTRTPEPPARPAARRARGGTQPVPSVDVLRNAPDRQAAIDMLTAAKVADLRAFAKANNLTVPAGNKTRMAESLANQLLGARIRSKAMSEVGDGELGYDERADREQRARIAGRGTGGGAPKPTREERDVSDPTPLRPAPRVGPGTDNTVDTPTPAPDEVRAFRAAEKTVAGFLRRKTANPAVSARPATLARARELGLVDEAGQLTPRGRAFAGDVPRKTPVRRNTPAATRRDGGQAPGGNQVTRPTPQKPTRVDPAPPAGDTPTGALPARQPQTRPAGAPRLTPADLRRINDRAGMVETPDGPGRVFGDPSAGWVTVGIYQRDGNSHDFLVESYKLDDLWEASDHLEGQGDMFADLTENEQAAKGRQRAQDRATAAALPILARQRKAKAPSDVARRDYQETRARLNRELVQALDGGGLDSEQTARVDAAGGPDAFINQRAHEIVAKKYKLGTGQNARYDGGPAARRRQEEDARKAAAAESRAARLAEAGRGLDAARTEPVMREALRGLDRDELDELARTRKVQSWGRRDADSLTAELISHRADAVRNDARIQALARTTTDVKAATNRAEVVKALAWLNNTQLVDFAASRGYRVPGSNGLPQPHPTRTQITDAITRATLPADHPDLREMAAVPGSRDDANRRYSQLGPNGQADIARIIEVMTTSAPGNYSDADDTLRDLARYDLGKLRIAAGRMDPVIHNWDSMSHGDLVMEMARQKPGMRLRMATGGKVDFEAYRTVVSPGVAGANDHLDRADDPRKHKATLSRLSTAEIRGLAVRRGVLGWRGASKSDLVAKLITEANDTRYRRSR